MKYFASFPIVKYNNVFVKNIIARVKVFERAKQHSTIYYPYKIKEGDRPDVLAYNYYGDSHYFWVIFIINEIVDPYFDWPMDQRVFDKYLARKYGSVEAAQAEILKYKKTFAPVYIHNSRPDVVITATDYGSLTVGEQSNYTMVEDVRELFVSPESWDRMSEDDAGGYTPVYAYDFEFDENEAKREIKLLDLRYVDKIEDDLKRLMKS